MRQEVAVLIALHGAQAALLIARDRQQDALDNQHWLDGTEVRCRSRYWSSVLWEIERKSGYSHQPDTATPYLDIAEEERRSRKKAAAAERRRRSRQTQISRLSAPPHVLDVCPQPRTNTLCAS